MNITEVQLVADALRPKLWGWCTKAKSDKLIEIIYDNKLETLIEIGVFAGSSLIPQAVVLKSLNKGIIYGIDSWNAEVSLVGMETPANKKWWSEVNYQEAKKQCQDCVRDNGLHDYVKLLQAKSEDVVNIFHDNSIDLIHIDGSHSQEPAYNDALLYLPKVKNNGWIVFDDIFWIEGQIESTAKAINYLLTNNCTEVDRFGDCLILRKG